jgi:transcriptional regulator with XRE-family HTH domain
MSEDVRPTFFEQQVRAAVQLSGWSYADLSRGSGISASQLGRYMSGEKGLSSEALGRLLDTIGCTLSTPSKMRERKKTQGRHPKPVKRVELTEEQVEKFQGLFWYYKKPTTGGEGGVRGTEKDPRHHRLHVEPADEATAAQEGQSRSPEEAGAARPTDRQASREVAGIGAVVREEADDLNG